MNEISIGADLSRSYTNHSVRSGEQRLLLCYPTRACLTATLCSFRATAANRASLTTAPGLLCPSWKTYQTQFPVPSGINILQAYKDQRKIVRLETSTLPWSLEARIKWSQASPCQWQVFRAVSSAPATLEMFKFSSASRVTPVTTSNCDFARILRSFFNIQSCFSVLILRSTLTFLSWTLWCDFC